MFCAEQTAAVKEAETFGWGKAAADSVCKMPSLPDKRHLFALLVISLALWRQFTHTHTCKDNQQVLVGG